jgi:hypothetical protein
MSKEQRFGFTAPDGSLRAHVDAKLECDCGAGFDVKSGDPIRCPRCQVRGHQMATHGTLNDKKML